MHRTTFQNRFATDRLLQCKTLFTTEFYLPNRRKYLWGECCYFCCCYLFASSFYFSCASSSSSFQKHVPVFRFAITTVCVFHLIEPTVLKVEYFSSVSLLFFFSFCRNPIEMVCLNRKHTRGSIRKKVGDSNRNVLREMRITKKAHTHTHSNSLDRADRKKEIYDISVYVPENLSAMCLLLYYLWSK